MFAYFYLVAVSLLGVLGGVMFARIKAQLIRRWRRRFDLAAIVMLLFVTLVVFFYTGSLKTIQFFLFATIFPGIGFGLQVYILDRT